MGIAGPIRISMVDWMYAGPTNTRSGPTKRAEHAEQILESLPHLEGPMGQESMERHRYAKASGQKIHQNGQSPPRHGESTKHTDQNRDGRDRLQIGDDTGVRASHPEDQIALSHVRYLDRLDPLPNDDLIDAFDLDQTGKPFKPAIERRILHSKS